MTRRGKGERGEGQGGRGGGKRKGDEQRRMDGGRGRRRKKEKIHHAYIFN